MGAGSGPPWADSSACLLSGCISAQGHSCGHPQLGETRLRLLGQSKPPPAARINLQPDREKFVVVEAAASVHRLPLVQRINEPGPYPVQVIGQTICG